MTPRQQRRLEQKLARKAEKKAFKSASETPISEAKLLANKANAQLSHGPVTPLGKEKVSQNATRHGLTGKFHVMPGESQADFDQMLAAFLHDDAPANQEEIEFVQQKAQALWLANRSTRLQDECIVAIESGTPEQQKQARKDLALYLRYQSTHERAYVRFSTELRKRRNERRKEERGFVSQKLREANENRKKEVHAMRQSIEQCKQERLQIQNRIAAAKAEAIELKNMGKKQQQALAAAA